MSEIIGTISKSSTITPQEVFIKSIDSKLSKNVVKNVYLTQDHVNKVYTRNPSCWIYGVDLSCASPWNSENAHLKAGTLISPQHIILALHYTYSMGTSLRFVDMNNNIVERKVVKGTFVSGTDISIMLLDSPVSSNISFAQVLPKNWTNIIPNLGVGLPAFTLDQEEHASIADIMTFPNDIQNVRLTKSNIAIRASYYEDKIRGDSGNPMFLLWGQKPVILTCLQGGFGGSGPSYAYYFDQINACMKSLGGGYSLSPINFEQVPNLWSFNLTAKQ